MTIPVVASYIGAFLVLLAFVLVSFKKISPTGIYYQALNGIGATGLAYCALTTKSWAYVIINTVWALVALFALAKIYLKPQN